MVKGRVANTIARGLLNADHDGGRCKGSLVLFFLEADVTGSLRLTAFVSCDQHTRTVFVEAGLVGR